MGARVTSHPPFADESNVKLDFFWLKAGKAPPGEKELRLAVLRLVAEGPFEGPSYGRKRNQVQAQAGPGRVRSAPGTRSGLRSQ
jgi:hypothetical protein